MTADDALTARWCQGRRASQCIGLESPEDDILIGAFDAPEVSAHVVMIHNWWLDMSTEAQRLWAQWKADHPSDD